MWAWMHRRLGLPRRVNCESCALYGPFTQLVKVPTHTNELTQPSAPCLFVLWRVSRFFRPRCSVGRATSRTRSLQQRLPWDCGTCRLAHHLAFACVDILCLCAILTTPASPEQPNTQYSRSLSRQLSTAGRRVQELLFECFGEIQKARLRVCCLLLPLPSRAAILAWD